MCVCNAHIHANQGGHCTCVIGLQRSESVFCLHETPRVSIRTLISTEHPACERALPACWDWEAPVSSCIFRDVIKNPKGSDPLTRRQCCRPGWDKDFAVRSRVAALIPLRRCHEHGVQGPVLHGAIAESAPAPPQQRGVHRRGGRRLGLAWALPAVTSAAVGECHCGAGCHPLPRPHPSASW